jgi:hypothetical protein
MPLARLGTPRALARARKRHRPSGQVKEPSAKEPLPKPLLQQRAQRAAARLVEPCLPEQERAEFRRSPSVPHRALAPRQ